MLLLIRFPIIFRNCKQFLHQFICCCCCCLCFLVRHVRDPLNRSIYRRSKTTIISVAPRAEIVFYVQINFEIFPSFPFPLSLYATAGFFRRLDANHLSKLIVSFGFSFFYFFYLAFRNAFEIFFLLQIRTSATNEYRPLIAHSAIKEESKRPCGHQKTHKYFQIISFGKNSRGKSRK